MATDWLGRVNLLYIGYWGPEWYDAEVLTPHITCSCYTIAICLAKTGSFLPPICSWAMARKVARRPAFAHMVSRLIRAGQPNFPSRRYQRPERYVGQILTSQNHLFSTTWIPSTPDTGSHERLTHHPSLLQPGGKPSVATSVNLAYS